MPGTIDPDDFEEVEMQVTLVIRYKSYGNAGASTDFFTVDEDVDPVTFAKEEAAWNDLVDELDVPITAGIEMALYESETWDALRSLDGVLSVEMESWKTW